MQLNGGHHFRGEVVEGGEAEAAGDARSHVEGDNGRPPRAAHEAPEEVRNVGESRPSVQHHRRSLSAAADRLEIGDAQGPNELQPAAGESLSGFEQAAEGGVSESGRVEPPSRGVH